MSNYHNFYFFDSFEQTSAWCWAIILIYIVPDEIFISPFKTNKVKQLSEIEHKLLFTILIDNNQNVRIVPLI